MKLKDFLALHKEGCAENCVSVHQMPYDYEKHNYVKTYFEEASQEYIVQSDLFKGIMDKQVDHFHVIGGGIYKVELCVYLVEDL